MKSIDLQERSLSKFSLETLTNPNISLPCEKIGNCAINRIDNTSIGVLNMLIMYKWDMALPEKFNALEPFIELALNRMEDQNLLMMYPYAYLTIRQNYETTTDTEWHLDGYSPKLKNPEQIFLWSDNGGTEISNSSIELPERFDPTIHNLYKSFRFYNDPDIITSNENGVYHIDTYNIHRRNPDICNSNRFFLRLAFSQILFNDINMTTNPLITVAERVQLTNGRLYRDVLLDALEF